MKYIFEQTDTGCVETLEFGGKFLKKEHKKIKGGLVTKDKSFVEQLEEVGVNDDWFLMEVDAILDGFMMSDLLSVAEEIEIPERGKENECRN